MSNLILSQERTHREDIQRRLRGEPSIFKGCKDYHPTKRDEIERTEKEMKYLHTKIQGLIKL